jgi:hypothetical protein
VKTKVRFGSLELGQSFEWSGKSLVKDGDRTAKSITPKLDFVFSPKDMVTITEPDIPEDDDDMLHNGFGCISGGAASDPQDLYDAYVYDAYVYQNVKRDSIQDRCN